MLLQCAASDVHFQGVRYIYRWYLFTALRHPRLSARQSNFLADRETAEFRGPEKLDQLYQGGDGMLENVRGAQL
jgi:hypothetical protein